MDRKIGKLFLILAALVILVALVCLFYPAPRSAVVKPLPNPNGYTSLVAASRMVPAVSFDYPAMSREELQSLVQSSSNALQAARAGLQQECLIPLEFSLAYQTIHLEELAGFKRLSQVLAAEGRLAEMEDRLGDAAQCGVTIVQLGAESGRGGVLIDCLVSKAIQAIGVKSLHGLTPRLDAKACRQTAAALETLDARREPWSDFMQRERDWSRRAFPGLQYRLVALFSRQSLKQAEEKGKQRFLEQQLEQRRLILELAARAWELEKGQKPKAAADLVPDYLRAVPKDPVTGASLSNP